MQPPLLAARLEDGTLEREEIRLAPHIPVAHISQGKCSGQQQYHEAGKSNVYLYGRMALQVLLVIHIS
jgi:hypothetical protein